jgi:hypothetical protein
MASLSETYIRFRDYYAKEGLVLNENSFVLIWDLEKGSLQIVGHCFPPVSKWRYHLLGSTHYLSFEIKVLWNPKASRRGYQEARLKNLRFLVRQLREKLISLGFFIDLAQTPDEAQYIDRRLAVWIKEVKDGKSYPSTRVHRTKNWKDET